MESFLSGRNVITRDKSAPGGVTPSTAFQPLFAAPPVDSVSKAAVEPDSEPTVEVIRGENGIQRIIVTCTCCKRIELECEYD